MTRLTLCPQPLELRMMISPVVVHCGVGALLAVISIPLILQKVPMNRVYGVRIAKAFASEANRYAINASGGRLLFAYGVLLIAFGFSARDFAPPPSSPWMAVFTVVPLLLIFPLLMVITAYARRLP